MPLYIKATLLVHTFDQPDLVFHGQLRKARNGFDESNILADGLVQHL